MSHAPNCNISERLSYVCSCKDLVTLLRDEDEDSAWTGEGGLFQLAATRIAALEAENERLRAALTNLKECYEARSELYTEDSQMEAVFYDKILAALSAACEAARRG